MNDKALRISTAQKEGFLTGKIGAALSTYLGSGLLGAGVVFL